MVQFVRKLLAENQERAFVPLREKALRVRPHSFADLSFVVCIRGASLSSFLPRSRIACASFFNARPSRSGRSTIAQCKAAAFFQRRLVTVALKTQSRVP
jgi:hypothetical protein